MGQGAFFACEHSDVSAPREQFGLMPDSVPRQTRVARQTFAKASPPARLYLKEWLKARAMKQAHITADLGWEPGRVSKIISGKQPYSGSDIAALATWLGIPPHELLMPPDEAESLRRLRRAAADIVAGNP